MDERNNAVEAFLEALTCTPTIYSSCYDYEGTLLRSNSLDKFFHTAFERVGCLNYMLDYAKTGRLPLILSAELGAMWCACFSEDTIYVIGPVFNNEISMTSIQEVIGRYDLTYSMRVRLQEDIKRLPVISSVTFFQFGVMLHFLLTGEKLSRSDLQLQERESGAVKKSFRSKRDRHQIWMVEQALLEQIRKGDLDYASTMARAGLLSNGAQVKTENAVKNAILSVYGFIRLCTRAAIEGGLSPELAYTLGDSYSQSLLDCKTISEVGAINHAMYEDFICRVHQSNSNPGISQQIRFCLDYIAIHTEDDLSLGILAEKVGYTASYLSRRFKAETGDNLRDYIQYARIERAKLLLETTTMPIAEIASLLHYCSTTYFGQRFREVTGMLPSAYRKEKQSH